MKEFVEFSARFGYSLSKKLDGIPGGGTTGWWTQRVIKLYGCAPESMCSTENAKTDEEYRNLPITTEAFLTAYNLRSRYYQRLYTVDDCRYAIHKTHGAAIEFDIFGSIKTTPDGYVELPKIGEKHLGSHSVMLSGYGTKKIRGQNRKILQFINSWGNKWGDEGRGYLPIEYFEHGLVNAAWSQTTSLIDELTNKSEKVTETKLKNGIKYTIRQNWYPPLRLSKYNVAVFDIYLGDSNLIIGNIHTSPVENNGIEIEEIFILPQYQNHGLGTSTLKIVEKMARSYGFSHIFGWIGAQDLVEDREPKIVSFFKKNGYTLQENGERFKDAAYKFEKDL